MAHRTSQRRRRAGGQDFVAAFVVRHLAVVAWMASSAIPGFAQPGEAGAAARGGSDGPDQPDPGELERHR